MSKYALALARQRSQGVYVAIYTRQRPPDGVHADRTLREAQACQTRDNARYEHQPLAHTTLPVNRRTGRSLAPCVKARGDLRHHPQHFQSESKTKPSVRMPRVECRYFLFARVYETVPNKSQRVAHRAGAWVWAVIGRGAMERIRGCENEPRADRSELETRIKKGSNATVGATYLAGRRHAWQLRE